ncbi:prephenate dehydratase [Candidatus Gastranaerophilus sp. (ex Termes propinquus)]|nr:prephenate dehydratase [Candidatus Gastranaerophilus sp. (ex Termes propinquus)]
MNYTRNQIRKILFLGPEGSYTQIAANLFCEKLALAPELEPVSTITKIMSEHLHSGYLHAVLPIENSVEGIVRETIDNMLHLPDGVRILSQCCIPVQHCLISKGDFSEIKNIISHPQALSQCQNYICEHFDSNINVTSATSTSQAAKSLNELDNTWAAIGNELCAAHYGLDIIARNINDNPDNQTRFVLLGAGEAPKQERTSIAFSTKNQPGALLEVLKIFRAHNLNMIYIESRPSKKVFGEYVFYIDLDCGANKVQKALDAVWEYCDFYRLLGSYSLI